MNTQPRHWRFHAFIAILVLVLAMGYALARHYGFMPEHFADMGRRLVGVIIGFLIIVSANAIPKQLMPWSKLKYPALQQRRQRATGRVFLLTGLAYAASWLLLPEQYANILSAAIVVAGTMLAVLWPRRMTSC